MANTAQAWLSRYAAAANEQQSAVCELCVLLVRASGSAAPLVRSDVDVLDAHALQQKVVDPSVTKYPFAADKVCVFVCFVCVFFFFLSSSRSLRRISCLFGTNCFCKLVTFFWMNFSWDTCSFGSKCSVDGKLVHSDMLQLLLEFK